MIFKFVRPANLQTWIGTNAPASVRGTPMDSWKAYLVANGGTGSTVADLEGSFLTAAAGGSLYDKWQNWLGTNGGTGGSARDKFNSKFK